MRQYFFYRLSRFLIFIKNQGIKKRSVYIPILLDFFQYSFVHKSYKQSGILINNLQKQLYHFLNMPSFRRI